MHHPSRYWADLSTTDFQSLALDRAIAVLPVAATEQHGPHLPLSVDTDLVNGVVSACLPHLPADIPALFLPTQTVGLSPEHALFAGTLTLKAETVIRLWTDIGESVAASGIRKLVLLNAHGGQVSVMDIVARDLRARLGMLVYSVSWFNLPLLDADGRDVNALFSAEEHRFGVHAGDTETSMMLALRPSWFACSKPKTLHPKPKIAQHGSRFWVTARAPSWAGKCKTTTPKGLQAMRLRQHLRKAKPCWRPRVGRWQSYWPKSTACRPTHCRTVKATAGFNSGAAPTRSAVGSRL